MGGVAQKIAAIQKRNDLYTGWENSIIEFVYFIMDSIQREVGIVALLQEDDSFDNIIVVDDLSVRAVDCFTYLP